MADSQTPAAGSAASDPDLSGRRLSDYRLLRLLGRGGMADVYLADQESLSRRVAFKVLRRSLADDESYVRRFLHEAKAAASLVHANIVQIHEVGCIDGIHFIVQEYVDGQNLKQLLDRQGALSVPLAVNVMRQVALALHKAGQQRITHRDIKPENIMLSAEGVVKVADFGLARVERGGQSVNLTQVGMTIGTPLYMSPEQVEGRPVDTRSDLYSFGVTSYAMLAGRPPFSGDSPLNIAVQHLKTEPQRLEDIRPDLPEGLCRVVHRMIAKAPEDRYQTAAELSRDLRDLNIEGLEQQWPSDMGAWSAEESLALADARTNATRQLDAVMKRERAAGRGRATVVLATAVAATFLLGGLAAWATRPEPLLEVKDEDLPQVEKQSTARDQFWHAAQIGNEQAWKSVEKYFPPERSEQNRYYALRAKQRLAEWYLQYDDLPRAERCYRELIDAGSFDPQFQAIGLAGRANILVLRDELNLAKQELVKLAPLLDQLPVGMRTLLYDELKPSLRYELYRLRNERPPSE